MTPRQLSRLEAELTGFLSVMLAGIGRTETRTNLGDYIHGLLLEGERKSMHPMAQRLAGGEKEAGAVRQRLQQGVCVCPWDEDLIYRRLAHVAFEDFEDWEAWVLDDTGFPKRGAHSVGVQRQYSGTLGRTDNCQVAVSAHLAADRTSVCTGMRLYLPQTWAEDSARRRKAQVPEDVQFEEKWRLALALLDNARAEAAKPLPVLADCAYGNNGPFRRALRQRHLPYLVGILGDTVVWPPASHPHIASSCGFGRPPTRHVDERHPPVAVGELAKRLTYHRINWREGSRGEQASRFAAVRVRTAHLHAEGRPPGPEQWLLCEWPETEKEPVKFYFSNLPRDTSLKKLVRLAKLRWRVERDYQEMKQEVGLDHYEGRTWPGFHHHVALCAIAHAFLALQRALFPPEEVLELA